MSSTKYLLLSCLLFASLFVYSYSRALIDNDSFVASNDDKELVSLDEDSSNDDNELGGMLYEESLKNDHLDSIESIDEKNSLEFNDLDSIDKESLENNDLNSIDKELVSLDEDSSNDDNELGGMLYEESLKNDHLDSIESIDEKNSLEFNDLNSIDKESLENNDLNSIDEESLENNDLDSIDEEPLENNDLDSIDDSSEEDHKKSGHKHKRHPCKRHSGSKKGGQHHGAAHPPKPSSNVDDFVDNEVNQYEGLDSFDEELLEMDDDDVASIDEESHDDNKEHGHKKKHHPCKRHAHSRKGKGKRSHAPVEPPTGSSNVADINTWMDLDESVASVDEESFDQMNYDDLDSIDEESNIDDHKESGGHKHKRHPCKRHSRKSGRHHHGSGPVQSPKPSYEINDIDNEMEQYEGVDSIDELEPLEMDDDIVSIDEEESKGDKKPEHKGKYKPCRRHAKGRKSHAHPPKQPMEEALI
ncbi:DEK domain-containing chromatin-associated protein 4-like [Impatiens glandulifera]|uniref:DEK domain-containing chromatin-associated protein 4-like n=1 Tax=Impatiens glandulifera TaxID=253017 RepID=UPI001FB09736|nr:DEK domain-containing chromatin-associated protein 4-like [Impatiens glandulifera]